MVFKPLVFFIIAYLVLLFLYFFTETGEKFKRRAINKIALALLFFGLAAGIFVRDYPWKDVRLLLLLGLGFACAGDITLLWSFKKGGVLFGAANLLLLAYELVLAHRLRISPLAALPVLLLFVALWGTVMLLYHRDLLDLSRVKIYPVYLGSVTLHGSLGLVLAVVGRTPATLLVGLGLFLMMVADYFLTVYEFKYPKNWILRCNSGAYFTGTLIAALSMLFPL